MSGRIEITGSPLKLVGLLACGGVMTGISLFCALVLPDKALIVGWVGTVFFAACTGVILMRLRHSGQPVIILSDEGLLDRRIVTRPIPWQSILRTHEWSSNGQRFIVVQVPPKVEAELGLKLMARMSRRANAALGADGLFIGAQGLRVSHQELRDLIEGWLARINGSVKG